MLPKYFLPCATKASLRLSDGLPPVGGGALLGSEDGAEGAAEDGAAIVPAADEAAALSETGSASEDFAEDAE